MVCLCVLIPAVCCLSMLVSLIGSVLLDATPSRVSIKTVPTTRRQAYLTQARQISRRTQKIRYEIFPGEELSGQNKKNICQAVQWRAEGELKQGKIDAWISQLTSNAPKNLPEKDKKNLNVMNFLRFSRKNVGISGSP